MTGAGTQPDCATLPCDCESLELHAMANLTPSALIGAVLVLTLAIPAPIALAQSLSSRDVADLVSMTFAASYRSVRTLTSPRFEMLPV